MSASQPENLFPLRSDEVHHGGGAPSTAVYPFWHAVVEPARSHDTPLTLQLYLEEVDATEAQDRLRALGLSARETEVLKWVARGRSNYGIAVILGLSERTVEKHLERIFVKLGVCNRTEAAARALACFSPQVLRD